MDIDTNTISIAYAGTLGYAADLETERSLIGRAKDWVWTYNRFARFSKSRSAFPLLKAISLMEPQARAKIRIHFWGAIDQRNRALAKDLGVDGQLVIEGMKSKQETQDLLATADMLYLPLEMNTPAHPTLFIPGKLFEYLSMAKPILCFSQPCDAKSILEASGLGVVFDPGKMNDCSTYLTEVATKPEMLSELKADTEVISSYQFSNKVKNLQGIIDKLFSE